MKDPSLLSPRTENTKRKQNVASNIYLHLGCVTLYRVGIIFSGFLNYVDACAEGLKEVSSTLKVGVPGGSCKDRYVFS